MEKINDTTVKIYRLYNYRGKNVVYSLEHLKGELMDTCAATIPHGCKIVDCEGGPAIELPDGLRTDIDVCTMYNTKNNSYRAFIIDYTGRNYYFSNIKEI